MLFIRSSIRDWKWILILNFEGSRPLRLYFEIYISLNPSFSASRIRCSILLTGRISPERPTSPAKHIRLLIGISMFEDKTAEITARSIAGSFTFIPPAILRKTSLATSLNPARFSKTANNIFNLLRSNPVDDRCGVPYTAELTSACVSIRKGLIPSIVAEMDTPLRFSSMWETNNSDGLCTSLRPMLLIS